MEPMGARAAGSLMPITVLLRVKLHQKCKNPVWYFLRRLILRSKFLADGYLNGSETDRGPIQLHYIGSWETTFFAFKCMLFFLRIHWMGFN
jgi:hypothetical protein